MRAIPRTTRMSLPMARNVKSVTPPRAGLPPISTTIYRRSSWKANTPQPPARIATSIMYSKARPQTVIPATAGTTSITGNTGRNAKRVILRPVGAMRHSITTNSPRPKNAPPATLNRRNTPANLARTALPATPQPPGNRRPTTGRIPSRWITKGREANVRPATQTVSSFTLVMDAMNITRRRLQANTAKKAFPIFRIAWRATPPGANTRAAAINKNRTGRYPVLLPFFFVSSNCLGSSIPQRPAAR